MTLLNDTSTVTYNGNGVTTSFPYNFVIPDEADARVGIFTIATGVLAPLTSGEYAITGIGNPSGGEVTYPLAGPALTSASRIVIWREVPYTQATDLTDQTPYYPTVLEDQLDRIVMQIQQLVAELDRSIKVTLGSALTPDQFVTDLQEGAAEAQASAEAAQASAIAAAASAANINLPTIAASTFLKAKADATGYDTRTAVQVADDDLTVVAFGRAQTLDKAQQGQARANIGADVLGGLRNKIINGDFDIWQRGTELASGSGYLADQWLLSYDHNVASRYRQLFPLGQTDVPGNPTAFHRVGATAVANANASTILLQRMEGVRTLSGKKATVTFYAKADKAKNISIELFQGFGTGGSPSPFVSGIGLQKFALTTSWQKFQKVVDVPTIAGKTLGTNNDDALALFIWLDAGSNFNARTDSIGQLTATVDIAHVSVVEGDASAEADPFSPRHIGQEMTLCERYCRIETMRALVSAAAAGNYASLSIPIRGMRALPAVTTLGTDALINSGSLTNSVVTANGGSYLQVFGQAVAAGSTAFTATRLLSAEL